MDNFSSSNPNEKADEPIRIGDKPIPFDDSDDNSDIKASHTPLTLGASGAIDLDPANKPLKPTHSVLSEEVDSPGRITGMKTFFTKLHAGSLTFLDQQITEWLRKNPDIVIKRTNTVAGMVIAKKTEPNIIVTIWY